MDGVGDIFEDKKEKSKNKAFLVCTENTVFEETCLEKNTSEEAFEVFNENNNCWPESERSESLDDMFGDDDTLNSPTHIIDYNSCLQNDPVNIDFISSFQTVLRGDPSFSPKDLANTDDILLETTYCPALWNNSLDPYTRSVCDKKAFVSVEDCVKSSMHTEVEFPYQDLHASANNFTQPISVSNYSNKNDIGPTASDKTFCLPIFSEDLLSTNQLDEKLDEDLNKGIQVIYENSVQSLRSESTAATNR